MLSLALCLEIFSICTLLVYTQANAGTGSLNGGLFQPGCLIDPDSQTNANGACTYQDQNGINDVSRDCMSGFWKIYDQSGNGSTKFYCTASCSLYNGFTPDLLQRTCTAAVTIQQQCPISQRAPPESDLCIPCPTNCLQCDDDLSVCFSCKNGYYLDPNTNQCLNKLNLAASILRVFVAPGVDPSTPNEHNGSSADPFYDIRDALAYVNEVSAQYYTRQVFIYLEKGTHHIILRNEVDQGYRINTARDYVQMEYDVTIQPLYCNDEDAGVTDITRCYQPGQQVTISNKIGAYFYFDVPRSLTLESIIFDAIDSMGTWDTFCLGSESATCAFDSSNNQIFSVLASCCTSPSQLLQHCNFDSPTSFIRIRYSPANSLTEAKALTIANCTFQHFFYQMNSLIQYPQEGASIKITGSTFKHFSTCGSIIKNRYHIPYDSGSRTIGGQPQVFNSYISQIQAFKEYPASQISVNDYSDSSLFNPFTGICANSATNKQCHSILITDSSFQHFDIFFSTSNDQNIIENQRLAYTYEQYTPSNVNQVTQRYRGVAIQLEEYPGSLTIQGSVFNDLVYASRACFLQNYTSVSGMVTESTMLNKAINSIKVEMPIVVTKSQGKIIFSRNTVTKASGSKGFMMIEMNAGFDQPTIIYNNTFSRISGFLYSGILNLRRISGSSNRIVTSDFCGGFLVQDNVFEKSVMCPKFVANSNYPRQGFVKFSCWVSQSQPPNDEVYEESALYWTSQGVLDYSEVIQNIEAYPLVSLEVDTRISTFKNNTFIENYRGSRGSLILAQGMPFLRIINTTYSLNQDVMQQQFDHFLDIQTEYGAFRSTPVAQMFQTQGTNLDENTGAIITVVKGHGVYISGDQFESTNWKDDRSHQKTAAYLHTLYTRGLIHIGDMDAISPPNGLCSSVVQQLVSDQFAYEARCGISQLPSQAYQPFFRIQHFNDPDYTTNDPVYQTDIVLSSFSLQNFQNNFGSSPSFMKFLAREVYMKIHMNLTKVTIDGANCQNDLFLDLRGINTDISDLTIKNIGDTSSNPSQIIAFGDQTGSTQEIKYSLSNVTFESVFAEKYILSLQSLSSSLIQLNFTDFNVISSWAQYQLLYVMAQYATVRLDGWNVNEFQIGRVTQSTVFEMYLVTFAQFSISGFTHVCSLTKSNCRVIFLDNKSVSLSIVNSDFSMAQANGESVPSDQRSSPFFIEVEGLLLANNTFHGYEEVGFEGGVFHGQIKTLIDSNSIYYSNRGAPTGGVFHLSSNSNSTFSNCLFYNNMARNGGVFQLHQNVTLTLNNCTFHTNHAQNSGGSLRVFGQSVAKVYNCSFYQNTADSEGAVMLIFSSEAESAYSEIMDTKIYRNRLPAARNPIAVLYSEVLFNNVSFYENLALEGSHNMYIGFSTVNITNSRFYVENIQFQYSFTAQQTQQFIVVGSVGVSIGENANVKIQNTTFENSWGAASMIEIQGYSKLNINNSTFKNLQAEYGAALQATSFEQIRVSSSTFLKNEGTIHGSDIYISNSRSSLFIHNTTFSQSFGTSVYMTDGDLFITQSLFTQQNYATASGGLFAIDCLNCITLDVQRTNFTFLNVDSVVKIENSSLIIASMRNDQQANIYFKDSLFSQISYAWNGGGLNINNYDFILLDGNKFEQLTYSATENTLQKGGAIHTNGPEAKNIRLKGNTFMRCSAHIGGAIYYGQYKPQVQSSNIFVSNSANIYGNDIAGYPVKFGFAEEAALTRQLFSFNFAAAYTSHSMQGDTLSSLTFSNIQSGGILPTFYVVVLDNFGQIVRSQSNNRLTVALQVIQSSSYAPIATLQSDVYSENGIFNVTGLVTIGQPGTSLRLKIGAVDLFDSTLPDVIQFQNQNGNSLDLSTTLSFRSCLPGEAFLNNGECSPCKQGIEYMLEVKTGPANCLTCPERANCFGGAVIGPKPSYWRATNTSVNFQSCLNPAACLGRLNPNDSELGNCAPGYRGILCAQCEDNYSRDSQYRCAKCPEPWRNILLITFTSVLTLAAIVFLVKYTISSAQSQKSPFSIYMKVLINHLQLIFLTSSFDLSWPDQVNAFYDQTRPVATVSDQIISLDCLLAESTIQEIGRFYIYLLAYLIMPILVAFLSLLVWWIKIRNNRRKICNRSTATIIIILFLLHPSITNVMFSTFYCRDVDGTLRLVQELDQVCWEGQHFWWGLLGGLPGLLCWAIGIPGFAWILLTEHKRHLENTEIKEKFGFLYKGYKLDTFYWECVIMYRKVAMIFISVFLNGIGTMIQALVVMVLLVFFIIITLRKKPYYSRKLNDLEMVSLVTSCITFYCGLYFLSAKSRDDPSYVSSKDFYLSADAKWFFFTIIIVANLCFFLFWISYFVGDVRHRFRDKCPRFYVCVCLCCRKGLLKEDIRSAKQEDAQEMIIETIEQLERSFKSVRKMYIRRREFVDKNKFQILAFKTNREMQKLDTNHLLNGGEKHKSAYLGKVRVAPSNDPLCSLPYNQEKRKQKDMRMDDLEMVEASFQQTASANVMVVDEDPYVMEKRFEEIKERSKRYEDRAIELNSWKPVRCMTSQSLQITDDGSVVERMSSKGTLLNFNQIPQARNKSFFAAPVKPRLGSEEQLKVEVDDMLQQEDVFFDVNDSKPSIEEAKEVYLEAKSVKENYKKLRATQNGFNDSQEAFLDAGVKTKRSQKININAGDILDSEDDYKLEITVPVKRLQTEKGLKQKVVDMRLAKTRNERLRIARHSARGIVKKSVESNEPVTSQDLSHLIDEFFLVDSKQEDEN